MSVAKEILFATGNPHKLEEVAAVLGQAGVRVIGLDAIGTVPPEPEEDGLTFIDNAILKASYYARQTGRRALADDSGLAVDALDGAPGVHSARYAGVPGDRSVIDPANNRKLLAALEDVADEQRTARFVCAMALCDPEAVIAVTQGTFEGRIGHAERGANGFGYDPLFELPDRGCTSAELDPAEKNRISHRGLALQRMLGVLERIDR